MFNFTTICESVKRHWIAIVLITALALVAGAGSSFVKSGKVETVATYTAEASLYVTGYGYDENARQGGDYNYEFNENTMMNDVRRIIVSKEVAAQIREEYGEDITITTPDWKDTSTKTSWTTRFCFIDVTAEDPDLALKVADEVASKVCDVAKETVPLSQVEVFDSAALKATDNSTANEWGTADLGVEDSAESVASRISMKSLVIYVFVGLCVSIFGFAVYDIMSRRVRSANDAERLLDIPVIASLGATEKSPMLAEDVRVLMKRSGLTSLAVVGATEADGAGNVAAMLEGVQVSGAFDLSKDTKGVSTIAESDAILFSVKEGVASGKQLENALKQMKISGTPVLGVVFISKK